MSSLTLSFNLIFPQVCLLTILFSPYDILDLPVTATEAEVKRQYRKKSLLIHPDKFKHEHGMEVRHAITTNYAC